MLYLNDDSLRYTRAGQLAQFSSENDQLWDIVIVGGGATGLGVAVDAAQRGLKTLLLEAHDFAKGTSSKSTKLVHGGVRYLAQGHISLVMEALHERGMLYRNAPHLVRDLNFVIPAYKMGQRSFYGFGLFIYDILAGRQDLKHTQILGGDTAQQLIPNLRGDELRGGVLYHDGQFDDSRLAINLAQTAIGLGAVTLNYMKVVDIDANDTDYNRLKVQDAISGDFSDIRAKVVVNATGIFVDDLLSMHNSEHRKLVTPSQGSHIVVDKKFLGGNSALMIPKTSDGRVLFAIPWYNRVILGTTDVAVKHQDIEPKPQHQELDFILQQARGYLQAKPTMNDILSIYAGLRPLAAPTKNGASTKEISRSHKIVTHGKRNSIVTVIGGKWTTYRRMAQDTLKVCEQTLGSLATCRTETLAIRGANGKHPDSFSSRMIYGSDAAGIAKLAASDVELDLNIHPRLEYRQAEIVWACRQEMAVRVEDVLLRRTRAAFLDARAALECSELVARIMQRELGKTDKWRNDEVSSCQALLRNFMP